MTYFFQGALFVTSVSPILSWGISHLHMKSGYHGWQ